MGKPNLLFVSPAVPAPTGNGLAMRAHSFLEVFSSRYRVHLLIVSHRFGSLSEFTCPGELCHRIAHVPAEMGKDPWLVARRLMRRVSPRLFAACLSVPFEWAYVTPRRVEAARQAFPGVAFDTVHVSRLHVAPFAFARGLLSGASRGVWQLDLDDVESLTRRRIGDLCRLNGDGRTGARLALDAGLYDAMQQRLLPRFDRVFVCSERDKKVVEDDCGYRRVEVVPNVVRIPSEPKGRAGDARFRLLFVGTLGYYPNGDAVSYFCDSVLPLIRRAGKRRFLVTIVGGGLPAPLARAMSRVPEVELRGYVTDLAPVYADSDAVIVPIRAGGGTRIKVLEAFSYRRPVVSTSAGAEGIAARDGEHLLIGDTAEAFARGCVRLMTDPELRMRLAESAFDLVRTSHTLEAMRRAVLSREKGRGCASGASRIM